MNLLKIFLFIAAFTLCTIATAAEVVNINRADAAAMIENWQGIGEKKARAIVAYRKKNGPFSSIDDLANVKGMGEGLIKKNKRYMSTSKGLLKPSGKAKDSKSTKKDNSKSTSSKSTTKSKSKPDTKTSTTEKNAKKSSKSKSTKSKSKKPDCKAKPKSKGCKPTKKSTKKKSAPKKTTKTKKKKPAS